MKGSAAKGLQLAPSGWHEHRKTDSVVTCLHPAGPGWGSPLPAQHLLTFSAQTLLQEVSSPAAWVVVNPSCRLVVAPCQEPFWVAGAIRRKLLSQAAQD